MGRRSRQLSTSQKVQARSLQSSMSMAGLVGETRPFAPSSLAMNCRSSTGMGHQAKPLTRATGLVQATAKCRSEMLETAGAAAPEKTDNRHRRLLRPRHEWPRDCHAAKRQYEFSPSDVGCHATLPWGSCPCNGGRYHAFANGRIMLLRCESLEPPCLRWVIFVRSTRFPTLSACPLRSDRVRTFAPQRIDAMCQSTKSLRDSGGCGLVRELL
jgi:hypothetical protein